MKTILQINQDKIGFINSQFSYKAHSIYTWLFMAILTIIMVAAPVKGWSQAASWNYSTQTGTLGTTYSWIDCSVGTSIVTGDDAQDSFLWPFIFRFYDNTYTTSNSLSIATNGFIRLDGVADGYNYSGASSYRLRSTATEFGQIISMAMYDGYVGRLPSTSWCNYLVTGTTPNRILTVEYNNLEIDYNDGVYADVQVSFYETLNKIVLKLGDDNIGARGVDMGIHSGVNTFFNKWQEIKRGDNNSWIEYTLPPVEVTATIGTLHAYYSTLKEAFYEINDGVQQGEITIKINGSTIETASAILNASGNGSANYSSLNIYPTISGLTISGNLRAPLIDLNGADNVTIDGRVNATGSTKDLIITNLKASSTAGTSTIRFINDASNNTIKYCTIKGSEKKSNSGVILFATTDVSTGNDDNTIDNNDITNAVNANRPVNAIYSLGTSGKDNSNNTISNNNIYDFFKHSSASRGILLEANTTEWTIDGNSFYETASYTSTGTVTYHAIKINNVSGNGFAISNNYFGGSEAQCGGTAWIKTNATNNVFNAMYINVGNTIASSIQNNTIQNFNWSNSGIADWTGINIAEGKVNIGTTTGNTIGSTTGTNSINVTGGTNGQNIYGIKILSTNEINCNNNSIGSITGTTTSTFSTHIYGLRLSGSATVSIANNTIGSTSTAASIYASSASTDNVQKVYGIYSSSTGTTTVYENTIANLKNNTSNIAVGTSGFINGIYVSAGTNTVCNNTVNDISISNASTSTWSPSAIGIHINTGTGAQSINENLIYNISNTYTSFTGCVVGIFTRNDVGSSIGDVSANFIHSLSVAGASTGANIYGIYENTDAILYSNNIISLGGNTSTKLYGIYDVGNSDKTVNLFFNTIYLSGTNSGSENSYAVRYNTNSNTRDLRNNILYNARSGGTGGHYAIYYDATGGTFTADYNDYYVSGTGGVIGYFGGDKSTLADLQTATSQDANSLNTDPNFTTAGGTTSSDYIASASLEGVSGTGVTTDYDGITRNNPPKMGALESSLSFVWEGNTSTDFATATNWQNGVVPTNGADISFVATPANNCVLDINRTLKSVTNAQSLKTFVVNGKELTITGDFVFSNGAQIDATTSSSIVIFTGIEAQSIPSGAFMSNTIGSLTLNNEHGLTLNGDLILETELILTNGEFILGANTLTLNGAITQTTGTITGGSTSNIIIGGSGATTTLPTILLNNLTLNRASGISLGGDISVAGTLALTSGTLTLEANTFTISGNSPTRVSGHIDASNSSATMELTNSTNITCPESIFVGSINNFTINGAGLNACCSCTINGILNLQSANPSSTMGTLDMGTDTLTLGANATIIGIGDVTGIVQRKHTFTTNTEYTFGNQYTTITFVDANTKPTWICVKTSIGNVPTWNPWDPSPNGKVKRLYQVSVSDNSSTSQTTINMRYLLSELDNTYNDESKLIFWHKKTDYAGGLPHEHGKANQDFINHFIGVTGLIFGAAATTNLDDSQIAIAYSVTVKNTWKGEVTEHETQWEQAHNWTAGTVPISTEDVLIPGGLTYYPSLTASANAVAKSIEIEIGASITANSYDITVSGSGGAWINNGTFNPGTGTVLFNHGVSTELVTIAGITNLYNISVGANTSISPVQGCILRIAGTASATPTSKADWSAINSTIEWNGTNQNILNPTGLGGNSGYYNLILSGSGTKTMPVTALNIIGDFTIDGIVTATAASELTIGGNLTINEGNTFATGAFDHTVGGNFDNSGTFTPSSATLITLNGTIAQSIYGSTATSFENLTIDNALGVNVFTDVTINNALTLTTGNLAVGESTLTINADLTKTAGFIDVNELSSLYFGGTTALTIPSNLFTTTPIVNNLTINRSGGLTLGVDLTVNGVLYLQSANPSSVKGILDMGSNTLNMGSIATNTGPGDVTGIIRRSTFVENIEYTFGNQFTSITFPNVGILPSEMSVKISIGSAPSWKTEAVNRVYDVIQIGGSGTEAVLKAHYLDSELNGNLESKIVDWAYRYSTTTLIENGRSSSNLTDNWIALAGADVAFFSSSFGDVELSLSESELVALLWNGSTSTSWVTATNWTPNGVPSDNTIIIIPDATTTTYNPTVPAFHTSGTITIEDGGVINSTTNTELTLNGSSGVWNNQGGTFNAGSSTIIITNSDATISGTSYFNNITINSAAKLSLTTGSITGIAGTLTNNGIMDAGFFQNTIEYNGTNQTIINLNGEITSGYYNLILSGSGTKTMPSTAMNITGDFAIEGTVTVSVGESLTFLGGLSIGSGSTFATGNYDHTISGNFVNNGTFTASADKTITMDGSSAQSISGTSSISFDNLTINNSLGVTLLSNVNINNVLALESGTLFMDEITLGINGTISKMSGDVEVSTLTSISFGGTDAITITDDLFTSLPILKNVTINQAGGVTIGNQSMTVNGILDLQLGTLHTGANTLTIAGSSPTRTSGTIDAVDEDATIAFTNSSAITLPVSIFTGNVNNLTIDGAGGVTASDHITLNGILELASVNPSSIKGSLDMGSDTLNMGELATTTGIGDVIGVVKRQHTFVDEQEYDFGNQFTTINFLGIESSPKPTWVSCKIVIGTAPTWRSEAINRYYSFAQSGGTDRMIVKLHYLDSELHDSEIDETQLVFWDAYDPAFGVNNFVKFYPRNKNDIDVDDNWIQLTGPAINYIATSSTTDVKQWGLSYSNVSNHTWTGNGSPSYDGDWSLPGNWNGGVPTEDDDVVIPDPSTLPGDNNGDLAPDGNLLPSITSCVAKTLTIESNTTLNASNYDIAIHGDANAWVNNGTFISGNSTVVFDNGSVSNIATITGTTNFNNITVKANTHIQMLSGSTIGIAGVLNANSSAILDFTTNDNTVDYNGSDQEIINPDGATITGYHTLLLSGTGTKTLPKSLLNILGDIEFNASISSTNNTIVLSGTSIQTITCPSNITLNNITVNNSESVIISGVGNISVEGTLTLTDGILATSTSIIDLGSSGQIIESPTNPTSYVLGNLKATRNIGGSNQTFGGIGLEINELGASNSTQVTRVTGTQLEGNEPSNLSIKRYFDIVPTIDEGLDATLKFYYFDWEVLGFDESKLILFKAPLPYVESTWTTEDNTTVYVANNYISLTGITDFSRWTAASIDEPLPIELLSFDGQIIDRGIKLLWSTATETNNDYFEIERSRDAENFSAISSVNGAGNSNTKVEYTFVDDNPFSGNNYYRLKQVDYNGDFEYHKTIVVNWSDNILGETSDDINIYPNPYYSGDLTLNLQKLKAFTYIKLSIIDISGKTIYVTSEQIPANKLIYIIPTAIDYLKPGIYIINVQTSNNMFNKKVIIK